MVSNVRASIGVGLLLGLTLSLLILMSTAPAQAQTLVECQTQITELRDATVAAETSFTNKNDWQGLLGKVDSASAKLTEGKTADALKNLDSILTKVSTLDAQNKLGEAEANALTVEATQARECVAGPQAQVPTTTA
jgi:hypothetical protein